MSQGLDLGGNTNRKSGKVYKVPFRSGIEGSRVEFQANAKVLGIGMELSIIEALSTHTPSRNTSIISGR